MHPVERRFAALHGLKATAATSGGADDGLYRALQALSNVAGELNAVVANGDAEAAAFAASVLDQNGGVLGSEVQSIQSALGRLDGDVRQTLFERPVQAAWGAVLASAQSHLNAQWRARVHDPFQARLADAYPFSNNAQPASLMDVEGYFHPQNGAVATFLADELGPFLGRDGSPKQWEGRGLRMSSAAQRALDDADRIASGLFNAGTMRVDFELQPEIPEREGNVPSPDAVYINIHGTDNAYRMGNYRPWTAFSWPGGAGATVTLSTRQGDVPVVRYDGDWALFRLLQDAQLQRRSASEYELRLQHDFDGRGRINVKYNLKPRSASGLFDDPRGFFSYRVPDALD